MRRRSAVDKKNQTENLSPLVRFRSSSGPKKIIDAFSHEGERFVKANGFIRAQELSENSARIDIFSHEGERFVKANGFIRAQELSEIPHELI